MFAIDYIGIPVDSLKLIWKERKLKFDMLKQKQQLPHVAEESKCIDAANCKDCKTYRQSQETGVLTTEAKLFEMPATKWQDKGIFFYHCQR